jgi:hypothetical protein
MAREGRGRLFPARSRAPTRPLQNEDTRKEREKPVDAVTISSIALGIVSIFISGFAIWLSLQFNDRSARALGSISHLAIEIRSMTEVSLGHQKDFSTKMLDSLIEMNAYGRPFTYPESPNAKSMDDRMSRRLEEQAQSLADTVEQAVKKIAGTHAAPPFDVPLEVQAVKEAMRKLVEPSNDGGSASVLPEEQRNALKSFLTHPAHYVLLTAILLSEAHSIDDLNRMADRYHVPAGYQGGILHLLDKGLLKGSPQSFSISPELIAPLTSGWRRIFPR